MKDFNQLYGRPPAVTSQAPGRVNLIGEHTDYNGGFVLPVALPFQTRLELAASGTDEVRVATALPGAAPLEYRLGGERRRADWADYVQGATVILARAGYRLSGFCATIRSDLPVGAGLSSSASLLVALLRGLRTLFELPLTDVQIASLSQKVENDFVGAHVGIMDQMAASLADESAALLLDTRDLAYRRVAIPSSLEFFVIDSSVKHSNVGGGYSTRRAECQEACKLLGIGELRDLPAGDEGRLAALPEVLRRRARHVVTENARVLKAAEALERADGAALGKLFHASHLSMKDDYQVSVAAIDQLVELAMARPSVYGARLTGGGFGGSIVGVTAAGAAAEAARQIADEHRVRYAGAARVVMPRATGA